MPPRGRFRNWFIAEQNWYLCRHCSLKRPQEASRASSQQLLNQFVAQKFHSSQFLSHVPYSLNASPKKRVAVAAKDPSQTCDPKHNSNAITDHRQRPYPARCYATSVPDISKEKSLPDFSAERDNLRVPQPLLEVGIREHLRGWQEAQLLNPHLSIPLNVPNSKPPRSRQNLIVHARDDEMPMPLHDTADLDEELEAIQDVEENIGNLRLIKQGDLVEFGSRRGAILALFVQDIEHMSQLYTMQGRRLLVERRSIRFSIPGFVSPHELDPIRPFLPSTLPGPSAVGTFHTIQDDIPRKAGATLISKLQSFDQSTNSVLREYAGRLSQAYEIMASPSEVVFARLQDIALKVLQKSDPTDVTHEMLWAVHKTVFYEPGFVSDPRIHSSSQRWEILPRNLTEEFSKVERWLRDYIEGTVMDMTHQIDSTVNVPSRFKDLNPVIGFVIKVQRLVKDNRKHRPLIASNALGTSATKVKSSGTRQPIHRKSTLSKFTTEERSIMAYLGAWCLGNPSIYTNHLTPTGAMILRATGLYGDLPSDASTAYLLLRETGVIAPWENPYLYSAGLRSTGSHDSQVERRAQAAEEFISSVRSIGGLPKDSMAGMRKEWQGSTVYCIDDPDATEIDDGISLERIDSNSSEFWVHIHVANPSAFIKPDHPVARFAAIQPQSIYLTEGKYPMLSPRLAQEYFSLADRRPCLTFSALLTTGGEIRSTKITPMVINNILHITPQEVNHVLDGDKGSLAEKSTTYTVGTVPEAQPLITKHGSLTTSQTDDLRLLSELGRARSMRRPGTGEIMDFTLKIPEPQVYLGNSNGGPTFNKLEACRFHGDPGISLEIANANFGLSPSSKARTLVSDTMILAGEIAAEWAANRNIPICYRGTTANPADRMSAEAFFKSILLPSVEARGYVDPSLCLHMFRLVGGAVFGTSPLKHDLIGCRAYARVTSPLRRFEDMLSHWQIEAALRYEHCTHSSLIGNTNEVQLPYSRTSLANVLCNIRDQERRVSSIETRSKQHWTAQLLFRAFYFQETQLPETFEMCLTTIFAARYGQCGKGKLKELGGIDVWLLDTNLAKREGGFSPGDRWEIKFARIDCYTCRIFVEAVKLISRQVSVEL